MATCVAAAPKSHQRRPRIQAVHDEEREIFPMFDGFLESEGKFRLGRTTKVPIKLFSPLSHLPIVLSILLQGPHFSEGHRIDRDESRRQIRLHYLSFLIKFYPFEVSHLNHGHLFSFQFAIINTLARKLTKNSSQDVERWAVNI